MKTFPRKYALTPKAVPTVETKHRRIVTKNYGRAFLTSLPPARRIDQLDALSAWFNGTLEDDVDY